MFFHNNLNLLIDEKLEFYETVMCLSQCEREGGIGYLITTTSNEILRYYDGKGEGIVDSVILCVIILC